MKVIWSPRAASDLNDAADYIGDDNSAAAVRVADRIYKQGMQLATMPHMGRIGVVLGTREMIFPPWPYIAVYKIVGDEVRIIRIRHASQQWP